MTSRKIYLCRPVIPGANKGEPFFSCAHHFGKKLYSLESYYKKGIIEKIAGADDELCEYCAGEHYNEQFEKSRKRARAMMDSLLGESAAQTKNDSL